MKINKKGMDLIKRYEGCSLESYKDPAGVWTVGYGHTGPDVHEGMRVTQAYAEELLQKDIEKACAKVDKYVDIYKFNENQYAALVSFAFNIGNIDQLTKNGTRTIEEIAKVMPSYCHANGKVMRGLLLRRQSELYLFMATPTAFVSADSDMLSITLILTRAGYGRSFEYRKEIAELNGIIDQGESYIGSVAQNLALCALAHAGMLEVPV